MTNDALLTATRTSGPLEPPVGVAVVFWNDTSASSVCPPIKMVAPTTSTCRYGPGGSPSLAAAPVLIASVTAPESDRPFGRLAVVTVADKVPATPSVPTTSEPLIEPSER